MSNYMEIYVKLVPKREEIVAQVGGVAFKTRVYRVERVPRKVEGSIRLRGKSLLPSISGGVVKDIILTIQEGLQWITKLLHSK